jgi:hypothetical protein
MDLSTAGKPAKPLSGFGLVAGVPSHRSPPSLAAGVASPLGQQRFLITDRPTIIPPKTGNTVSLTTSPGDDQKNAELVLKTGRRSGKRQAFVNVVERKAIAVSPDAHGETPTSHPLQKPIQGKTAGQGAELLRRLHPIQNVVSPFVSTTQSVKSR